MKVSTLEPKGTPVLTSMVSGVLSPLAHLNERLLSLVAPLVDLPEGLAEELEV